MALPSTCPLLPLSPFSARSMQCPRRSSPFWPLFPYLKWAPSFRLSLLTRSLLLSVAPSLVQDRREYSMIGYQVISGFGTGLALALPQVAVQPGLTPQDISIGISMTIFFQVFGGALSVSVGNNILNSKIVQYVSDIGIPNFDARQVVQACATELRRAVPAIYLSQVRVAYNEALRPVFRAGLAMACLRKKQM